MKNEKILLDKAFKPLLKKLNKKDFLIDKTGCKIIELFNETITGLNPAQPYLEFNGKKTNIEYVQKESKWYNSKDLNINGWVDDIKIWKQCSDRYGFVNSNYGWMIYSKENYLQFEHCVEELINNKDSRRATMIYLRPSMWIDYKSDGMNEFTCTFATHWFIRDNKLVQIVYMRSNDLIYGFMNDFAWHCEVHQKVYNRLKVAYPDLKMGQIDWHASSLHVYERHFDLFKKMCKTNITINKVKKIFHK